MPSQHSRNTDIFIVSISPTDRRNIYCTEKYLADGNLADGISILAPTEVRVAATGTLATQQDKDYISCLSIERHDTHLFC